jgi:ribosome maturation factor RimP
MGPTGPFFFVERNASILRSVEMIIKGLSWMSVDPSWIKKIESIVNDVAEREGCLLYDVEFVGAGKGRVLRIFIDRNDGNVTIDDCSQVSKGLNEILDANEELIPGGSYSLEVSTPGLDRSLKKPWHFQKVIGKKIYIKTQKPLESLGITDKKWKAAKTVEDVLEAANDSGISFMIKDVEIKIPYSFIEKAKLVFDFNKIQKK